MLLGVELVVTTTFVFSSVLMRRVVHGVVWCRAGVDGAPAPPRITFKIKLTTAYGQVGPRELQARKHLWPRLIIMLSCTPSVCLTTRANCLQFIIKLLPDAAPDTCTLIWDLAQKAACPSCTFYRHEPVPLVRGCFYVSYEGSLSCRVRRVRGRWCRRSRCRGMPGRKRTHSPSCLGCSCCRLARSWRGLGSVGCLPCMHCMRMHRSAWLACNAVRTCMGKCFCTHKGAGVCVHVHARIVIHVCASARGSACDWRAAPAQPGLAKGTMRSLTSMLTQNSRRNL